jgi:peptidoglycan hydrolase-like protein with peptidoglycan-binding domain
MKKQPTVDVRALQQKLKAKGYYKGPIDGVVGPSTRSALQRFMQR